MASIRQKQKDYIAKYGHIPLDYKERLDYMCDVFNISYDEMIDILHERHRRMHNLYYNTIRIVLNVIPEGAKRPRYRFVNRSNLVSAAINDPSFIHVYSPGAAANHEYMKRLVDSEIVQIQHLICTPCDVHFKAYFPTPKSFTKQEAFMAEFGLDRPLVKPDWDNIGKLYSDMYNSNIWIDDALTIRGVVDKFYSILPRVEIDLSYLNAVYSKQQYQSIVSRKDYDENMNLKYV
jgi:Holliday junction resolvase RusA-like endonuclease